MTEEPTTDTTREDDVTSSRSPADEVILAMSRAFPWQTPEDALESARRHRDARVDRLNRFTAIVIDNDLPWPFLDNYSFGRVDGAQMTARYRVDDLDAFRVVARAVRRAIGGMQTKANDNGEFVATCLAGDIAFDVVLSSASTPCEQVKVGTKTVTDREEISPPRYREVEREVDVYEYRCPDSILDPDLAVEIEADDTALLAMVNPDGDEPANA
ncbi:MAG: hypothetical protein ABR616_10320 [Dermatophilaceae bacterium]